jgi:glycerophosphoryl diester phosphodiesterase
MIILSHRANRNGVDSKNENSQEAIANCLSLGWGIEMDIRRASDGSYYISHDEVPHSSQNDAEQVFRLIREMKPPLIALNIKELGYERDLIAFLIAQGVLEYVFLFDMELLEDVHGKTAELFRRLDPTVRLAARCSDRGEPLERAVACPFTSVVWADEFDQLWIGEEQIQQIKAAGKTVFAISPEIHHFSMMVRNRRWSDFCKWKVDGICTDYPEELQRFLMKHPYPIPLSTNMGLAKS